MSDISNQLIKDSYNYVLQSDIGTGVVYRIGGLIPVNPIFQSGLTVNGSFTYSDGSEQLGYVLTCDALGNAIWAPVSAATPSSGVTSVTATDGLSGNVTTGAITISNIDKGSSQNIFKNIQIDGNNQFSATSNNSNLNFSGINLSIFSDSVNTLIFSASTGNTVTISGGTGIEVTGSYPNYTINFTGSTGISGDYLPLSGGTVTGGTIFSNGLTANTISATTYFNLPVTGLTEGNGISITPNGNGNFTITSTATTSNVIQGITGITGTSGVSASTNDYGTIIINTNPDKTVVITGGTGIQIVSNYPNFGINYTGSTGISGDYLPLSGGTVSGGTIFTNGLTANTISATTYYNLPVSGLTEGNGISITPNGNGNFTITSTGSTSFSGVTSITVGNGLSANSTTGAVTIVFTGSTGTSGDYLPLSGGTVTGGTVFTNGLTANTISATTYYNLPKDVFVTGGTYANGTATFTNNTGGTFNVVGFPTATGTTTNYYGSFTDTSTQPVNGANTPTAWSANTTELSNGIYIVDGSKITVSNDGVYEIGYSAQIEKTQGGASSDVTIWATINGNVIDRSSSTITLANNSTYQLPFVSYILDLYAGDYVQFYFSSPSQYVQLTTLSGLTSPTRPVSPSLILVAKAIGNAVLSNSGDSYVTGFTLTNNNLTLSQNRLGQYSGFSVNLPYLNTSGGTITGNLNVTGSVTASTYYGYGGYLTGISRGGGGGAGGQLYYFNISNTQTPYYEFSTTATTASEQTISATTGASQTAYIGGFMTPSGSPGITNFPAGILSFYLHAYDGTNHNFNIYCQLYKRTSGGSETLLFTSDPTAVAGDTPEMVISDGYFSGATLDVTDRLVVKVYATNLTNQTRTIYFVSEGSDHYSFALTTIPTFTDTYVTGFTYSNNTFTIKQNYGQPDLSQTINTMTGLTVNGNLYSTTVSATTYQNLPIDIRTTGATYSNNTFTFTNNTGGTYSVLFNTVTGLTVNGNLNITGTTTSTTISATTYQNLPSSFQSVRINNTTQFSANTDNFINFSGVNISIFSASSNTLVFSAGTGGSNTVQGITGITATDGLSGNTSSFATTIINIDKGSSQNIFKNIQVGGIFQFSASSNNSNLNFSGIGLTITSGSNNTLVFSASPGGVASLTVGSGLSGNSTTGAIALINTQVQGITGKTDGAGISSSISNNVISITNTDLGSSQNIFKNIQIGGVTQFSAGSNNSNLNFSGVNITITSADTNTLVFTNAGVTSITAGYGISASTSTGNITITQVFDYGKAYTTGNNLNYL